MTPPLRVATRRAPVSVADWRRAARGALPGAVWSFLENGADGEDTLRRNAQAYRHLHLRPSVAHGRTTASTRVSLFGQELASPILLAPIGHLGLLHPHADIAAAKAAHEAGSIFIQSSGSSYSIEEVGRAVPRESRWFQCLPWGTRETMKQLVLRAKDTGFSALMVTVDAPVMGNRLGERTRGLGYPPRPSLQDLPGLLRHPRWTYGMVRHRRTRLANLLASMDPTGARVAGDDISVLAERPGVHLEDLEWIRRVWDGPLLIKGILDERDVPRLLDIGADGLVVSNHGGRQLSPASATLCALEAVVERVAGRVPVLLDGGITRGHDVAAALALGAEAVLIGRSFAYGLAAGGQRGVGSVLAILAEELERTLVLMGVGSAVDLTREHVEWDGPNGSSRQRRSHDVDN